MFSLKINTDISSEEVFENMQNAKKRCEEDHYDHFDEPALVQLTEDDIFTNDVRDEIFIARGGFGSVSRAEYGEGNTCIVKTIIVGDGKKEASKLKELDGIIPTFLGYKEEENTVKIYMEKCDGSVDNLIKSGYFEGNNGRKMDFVQQVFVLTQTLKESNFAHCDLKSGNIGYIQTGEEMVYKLLDFGSACKLNDNGQGKAGLTTMDFKAPERIAIRSNVYDGHKLDIYAIGGMFFNLETGEMPMDNVRQLNRRQPADIIADRIEMKLVDYFDDHTCHDIPANISERMQNIIRDCWESDPEVRKSAEQMLAYHF